MKGEEGGTKRKKTKKNKNKPALRASKGSGKAAVKKTRKQKTKKTKTVKKKKTVTTRIVKRNHQANSRPPAQSESGYRVLGEPLKVRGRRTRSHRAIDKRVTLSPTD